MTRETALRALREGEALLEVGRNEEALRRFAAAVASDPENAEAQTQLARALNNAGRHEEALEAANSATSLEPGWEWPHRVRSIVLVALGRSREAVMAAEQAVACDPEFAPAHEVLADALIADRQYWPAFHVAERARALDPERSGPWETMAQAFLEIEKWDEAIECLHGALERDPENAMAHNNLGYAYLNKGKKKEAHEALSRAVQLDPSEPLFRENLALASRVRANPQWMLYVFLFGGIIALNVAAGSDSGGEVALGLLAVAAAVFATWWIVFTIRTWNAPAGERHLLKRQSFFERFDFVGWTPWPFLIPSPIWFLGSSILFVSSVLEIARKDWWNDTGAWAFSLTLLLIALFSAGRARLYLGRTGHWPPWTGWR